MLFSSNIVAAFGRSQKRTAAFGHRPLLVLYLMKKHPKVVLEVFFTYLDFSMFSGVPLSRRFLGSLEIPIFHHFDHFGTFQKGYPENPKIHDFDDFCTFPTGHLDIPKIHHVDHSGRFPDFTECN